MIVTLFRAERYDGEWMPEKLHEAIAWLLGYLNQVPEEYRDRATIEISSESGYEDSHYASILIEYQRPDTKEEEMYEAKQQRERLKGEAEHHERQAEAARQRLAALKT